MPNIMQRFLRIEPGVTLGQWLYDRIANNWERIIALFVAGGGMTYFAAITTWIKAWGPFGIAFAGLMSGLIALIAISYAQSLRAKARLRNAQAEATKKWEIQVDGINPLATDFHAKRINILDLKGPVDSRIIGKRFIDCELIGPANVAIMGSIINNVSFIDCDTVVVKENTPLQNAVALQNCNLLQSKIMKCTIFIGPADVPMYVRMGATFATLTGDAAIDARVVAPKQPQPQPQIPPLVAG